MTPSLRFGRPTRGQVLLLVAVAVLTVLAAVATVRFLPVRSQPAPATTPAASSTPDSGLPRVAVADLPGQAHEALRLIDAGGPFPYRQDGTVFANQEGHLPARPTGYYREYTVATPGSPDRGARRLVVGTDGDVYYTDDHYDSFRQVAR
jgi:ribonuclease T1